MISPLDKVTLTRTTTHYEYAVTDGPTVVKFHGTRPITMRPGKITVYVVDGVIGFVIAEGFAIRKNGTTGTHTQRESWHAYDSFRNMPDWISEILDLVGLPRKAPRGSQPDAYQ